MSEFGIRYRIEYEEGVQDQLAKFPKNIQARITKAIKERLSFAPNEYGKPLTKEWKDHRRLRIGDFRVIYKVFEDLVVVFIVEIDHRRLIYKD